MNVTLTLMENCLLSNSDMFSDVQSDALALNTCLKLSSKIKILALFRIHAVSTLCDLIWITQWVYGFWDLGMDMGQPMSILLRYNF